LDNNKEFDNLMEKAFYGAGSYDVYKSKILKERDGQRL
jgi:hypothetical protein